MLCWSALGQADMGMGEGGDINWGYSPFRPICCMKGLMVRVPAVRAFGQHRYGSSKGTMLGPGWGPRLLPMCSSWVPANLGVTGSQRTVLGVGLPPLPLAEPFSPAPPLALLFQVPIRITKLAGHRLCKACHDM